MTDFQLVNKNKFKLWSLPKIGGKTTYESVLLEHPAHHKQCEFLVFKEEEEEEQEGKSRVGLLMVNQLAWEKPKSQSNGGKAFKTLVITNEDEEGEPQSGVVLGEDPIIHIGTPFSLTYVLLGHYLSQMKKINHLEEESSRMVSYDDLLDTICDSNEQIHRLVHDHGMNLEDALNDICEVVIETFGNNDDDCDKERFYKLTKGKILEVVRSRIETLAQQLPTSLNDKLKETLMIEDSKAITGNSGPTNNNNDNNNNNNNNNSDATESNDSQIFYLARLEQAVKLIEAYVDIHYIENAMSHVDWSPLRSHLKTINSQDRERRLAEQSIESLAQSSGSKAKKSKPPLKQKPQSTPKVARGKGALDMFFSKRKTSN